MTNDEIANRIADQMNKVIEGITGPTTQALGERVIKVEPTTQDQIDVEKELAFHVATTMQSKILCRSSANKN